MRDPTQRFRVADGHGRLLCDPVLRFENIDVEFAALCLRLGLSAGEALPRRNTSTHRPYREYYERRATRDAVVDLFGVDFDAFGYATEL